MLQVAERIPPLQTPYPPPVHLHHGHAVCTPRTLWDPASCLSIACAQGLRQSTAAPACLVDGSATQKALHPDSCTASTVVAEEALENDTRSRQYHLSNALDESELWSGIPDPSYKTYHSHHKRPTTGLKHRCKHLEEANWPAAVSPIESQPSINCGAEQHPGGR